LVAVLLSGCADEDAQNPPVVAPVPAPTTYVTTNNTYNSTVIYENGAAPDAAAPSTVTTSTSASPPRNSSQSGTPRDLATTGVPECDAYLARVESCSHALLSSPSQSDAFDRITAGLDTARRAWRKAAVNPAARDSLKGTCADSLTQYNASVTNVVCK
jgi:hypothetical protein